MSNSFRIIVFLALTTAFYSCKTTKEVAKERTNYRSSEKVIGLTKANDLQYHTGSMKANITISDESKKLSFKASIRIHKDSLLWSSLTLMGIAGARSLITNDTIKIVNYKEKNYIIEEYAILQDWLNTDLLSFSNFQNLILGDWIEIAEYNKYRLKINDGEYFVSTVSERRLEKDWVEKKIEKLEKKKEKQESKESDRGLERLEKKQEKRPRKYEGMELEIVIDPYLLKVKKMKVRDYYFNGGLTAEYSDFKLIGENQFPHFVNLSVDGNKKMNVEIEFYKISLDEEISTPFSIPKKYERVKL